MDSNKFSFEDNPHYTPYYCEENIYRLAQNWKQPADKAIYQPYVVFITNPFKQTYLRNQKNGDSRNHHLVVWDYHVILLVKQTIQEMLDGKSKIKTFTTVFDFDTTLGFRNQFDDYFLKTFKFQKPLETLFRVVEAREFLKYFASDRSHMIKARKKKSVIYEHPVPPFDAIKGESAESEMNLMDFIDSGNSRKEYGKWMREEEFFKLFRANEI